MIVLDNLSFCIPAGKMTALVGSSGSGKSTIIALLERFYDPVAGTILLDGHDIRGLQIRFLRQQMGFVSQEPTLFNTTFFENIAYGLKRQSRACTSTQEQKDLVEKAAKISNAHDFIIGLPGGYGTRIGVQGSLLSGGQKQRIAIARAIVSDPKILILDEATSALDSQCEGIVQSATTKASKGRTALFIAHRLSAIMRCENVVVLRNGTIVEQGTHAELMERGKTYFQLVETQMPTASIVERNAEDWTKSEHAMGSEALASLDIPTKSQDMSSFAVGMNIAISSSDSRAHAPWYDLLYLDAQFHKQDWLVVLLGVLCSVIAGAGNPILAVFFAHCVSALSLPSAECDNLRSDINFWSGMIVVLAFTQLMSLSGQGIAFAISSERLLRRVRALCFRTMLRQDISFFDAAKNTAGILTSFSSTEPSRVASLAGATLGTILSVVTTLVVATAAGMAYNARLAGVFLATVPISLGCGYFRSCQIRVAHENGVPEVCQLRL